MVTLLQIKELLLGLYFLFVNEVLPRVQEIFTEPFKNEHSIWLVAPLIIVLLFMSIYFGKHRNEELGWNTAFGNSISLIFVCAMLMKYVYENYTLVDFYLKPMVQYKAILIAVIVIQALSLLFLDFFHTWPKKVAFFFSSPVFVNTTAFLGIVLIESDIAFDWVTLFAALTIYVIVFLISSGIRHAVKPSKTAEEFLERKKERKAEEKRAARISRALRWENFKEKIIKQYRLLKLRIKIWWNKIKGM